ncbi:juvenile hormone esterase-like [Anoplophora glabripennis]|uniref:juvenile hormone esterase-like n=1 Tax=Anoplophora glabripennis TaxID=217634 RepID=UPI000874288C|nr:juvenile hormone esterase-like [Anoplophora glabripennis]
MAEPIVSTKQGQLKGFIGTDIDGGPIISFLGVPFAKPPLGELRFKDPLPAEPWDGIKDATKDGDNCYGHDLLFRSFGGSEDCLNLNVFTKSLTDSKTELKPVMVFIYGGGFFTGSNKTDMYGPEFLLTQDIVLVVPNYRLGVLGFLCSDDDTLGVPGNAGLKDQIMALQWVQENIRNFNGDPNNVTIFGESAGSLSVHYLILYSRMKGLFHRAILQSGTALMNFFGKAQHMMVALAKVLGHDVSSDKEALDILRQVPVELLYQAQGRVQGVGGLSSKPCFGPIIEKPSDTAFITEEPIDILMSGNYNQVPLIIGYNSGEGLFLPAWTVLVTSRKLPFTVGLPNLEDTIPHYIGLQRGSDISKQVCEKLKETYFDRPDLADNKYLMITDAMFVAPTMATVKNHVETSRCPIFIYRMSLEAGLNLMKVYTKLTEPGACHVDDLGYLFKNDIIPPFEPGSIEDISVRRFVKLWTNFAKYGNPTPDENELGIIWKPVETGQLNFIDIGNELTSEVNPESERMQLWKEIYQLCPNTASYL